jgi:hypothetical protein
VEVDASDAVDDVEHFIELAEAGRCSRRDAASVETPYVPCRWTS